MQPTQHQKAKQKKARAALWKKGNLDFLMDDTQKEMRDSFFDALGRIFIFLCSRRLGKSYLLCVIACAASIQAKTKVIYITGTNKAAKKIVQPLMAEVLTDCPEHLRPQFKTQDNVYVWPNGSEIHLYGIERDPDAPRGQEGDLILIDEAGFVDKLGYLVKSVLLPMLLMTNGRILMATTPPKSLDHPFYKFLHKAEATDTVICKTIDDCPRVTPKMRAEYCEEAGGEESNEWRREYLCERIQDVEKTVIPEWSKKKESECVREISKPQYCDLYTAMDLGFVDHTAAVMGFYDFPSARLCILNEMVVSQSSTATIAKSIITAESAVFGLNVAPFKRIGDSNNPQLLYDLSSIHGISFSPACKVKGREGMINHMRLMIARDQIWIHPRCKNLILQLRYCVWKGNEKATFARTEEYGHFDLVDALIILANSIVKNRNVIPNNVNVHTMHAPRVVEAKPLDKFVPRKISKIRRRRRF